MAERELVIDQVTSAIERNGNGFNSPSINGQVDTEETSFCPDKYTWLGSGPAFETRLGVDDVHVGTADYYLGIVDIPGGQPHWGKRGWETKVITYFGPKFSFVTVYVAEKAEQITEDRVMA